MLERQKHKLNRFETADALSPETVEVRQPLQGCMNMPVAQFNELLSG